MTADLSTFLPYMLAQAAETVSAKFQPYYRERYGMLRTEWRVLFHLGQYGDMTAKGICDLATLHKTKVSRAVRALQQKGFLKRSTSPGDKRAEVLSLTPRGVAVFEDLSRAARSFEADLTSDMPEDELAQLRKTLKRLADGQSTERST